MISTYTYKKLTWVDLESPTEDEVRSVVKEYNLRPLVGEEILHPNLRSKVDRYDNLIYLILYFPALDPEKKDVAQEIDFVVGKDFIITVHYKVADPIREFPKILDANAHIDRGTSIDTHAGYILYYLIKELYRYSADQLAEIDRDLDTIEENIFDGNERDMVEVISHVNKKLVDWKRALRFHGEILRSLEHAGRDFFGETFSYYLSSISGEYRKIQNSIDGHKETLDDLRITNDSLLTDKTNETMRTLTIMSFVIFPLTLIAGVFGMNTIHTPIIGERHDFWTIIALMAVAVIIMYIFFKRKKWL